MKADGARSPHATVRRVVVGLFTGFLLAACSNNSAEVGSVPQPAAFDQPVPTDSAQDEAALNALRDLEFGSLAKDPGHVRGVLPASVTENGSPGRDAAVQPRGGTASASAPTYDLDIESYTTHGRVKFYVDYFLEPSRNRFTIWLARLGRYEGMIRHRFRRYGLPEDLVYLALIESGYSNTAVSRARAVGMWQFIASTGRRYGLRIDNWVDERRDPFLATDAAARHLVDLKNEFGSWYLAAAAYNGGARRVSRGIQRLPTADSVSDQTFFALLERRYLRRETRDYVPKLIAATIIAKDAAGFGFHSITPHSPLVFDEIAVPDQTGLDVIAVLADTTRRALVELNPRYYRGATPPGDTVIVRVPRGTGSLVALRYAGLPSSERVNFLVHRVRRGETLGQIGRWYGVSVRQLRAANNRVHPRRLRIGQRLTIPVSQAARGGAISPPRRASTAQRVARAAPPVSGLHRVRAGDSLWIVSQRYGVTVKELRRWNSIPANDSFLQIGQLLRVAPE